MEPYLRDKKPTPLERPLFNVNFTTNVFISTSKERPPILKGHIPVEKGVGLTRGVPLYIKEIDIRLLLSLYC